MLLLSGLVAPAVQAGTVTDLVDDPGFETSVGGFQTNESAVDGSVTRTLSNPIEGQSSLKVTVKSYGRIVRYHAYPYAAGPLADSVTVKAKLRVDGASAAGKKLEVCSIAYLHDDGSRLTQCQEFPVSKNVVDVLLPLSTSGRRLSSVIFQFKLNDSGSIKATVDDAHLLVQEAAPTPPSCTADVWSCGDWSACGTDGTQSRSCAMTMDCPDVTTPSPPTTQSCSTPPPSGQLPPVPDGYQLVDLLPDGSFEASTSGFEPLYPADGSVARTTVNPIEGNASLRADINAWGRIAASHDYPYGGGPLGDSVTVKARIRVDGASPASSGVEICSIAYLETDSEPRSKCQAFPVSQNLVDVFLTLDTGRQQLDRVFF